MLVSPVCPCGSWEGGCRQAGHQVRAQGLSEALSAALGATLPKARNLDLGCPAALLHGQHGTGVSQESGFEPTAVSSVTRPRSHLPFPFLILSTPSSRFLRWPPKETSSTQTLVSGSALGGSLARGTPGYGSAPSLITLVISETMETDHPVVSTMHTHTLTPTILGQLDEISLIHPEMQQQSGK